MLKASALAEDAVVSGERGTAMKREYPFVRFSVLADFAVPPLQAEGFDLSPHAARPGGRDLVLPDAVRALDGKRASIRGYMLPIDIEGDRVTRFILTATIDSCHFGMIGQANEWVMVTMATGRNVPFPKSLPITVFGRLSVHPEFRNGGLAGLYLLTADAIAIH